MTSSRSQIMRQSLHIRIDPSPYDKVIISPESSSPSPEFSHLNAGTARTSPTSSGSDQDEFPVLCMYDFRAADLDQLSFRKNEILLIVKRETTGWWAAMRRGGDIIGWIPQAFVNPLSDEMAQRLVNIREDMRSIEYRTEQLYPGTDHILNSEPEGGPTPRCRESSRDVKSPERNAHDHRQGLYRARIHHHNTFSLDAHKSHKHAPPSPTTPVPPPPVRQNTGMGKPIPHTPNERDDVYLQDSSRFLRSPSIRRYMDIRGHTSPELSDISNRRKGKPLPTEDYSQPVLVLQAPLPWYLKPKFADQLDVDADCQVLAGTVPALVERLMATDIDHKQYQDAFLMTFRSFMSSDELFNTLVEYYNISEPDGLNVAELEDWLERAKGKTQRKVLEIFSDWLQGGHLLEQEPHIAGRLTDFLQSITTGPNHKVSKLIQERIKDLTFAIGTPTTVSPLSASRKRKHRKGGLLEIGTSDLAEQLTAILFESYRKILPHECITYTRTQSGCGVVNLREFCAYHDKVSHWVQTSILTVETTKRRAETVDYWIKVAEKCRVLNNIASMSAIITALNSTVITRLPLTWAHISKKSILDSLSRYNDPLGGFSAYRKLNDVDGPCLPFIAMYLTDMAHIHDQFSDKEPQIYFYKRKRFYDVISMMLRHQKEPYTFPLDDTVAVFIRNQLQQDSLSERQMWKKSEEVQQSELAHADIRRGLEKAGF